jgi:hypothetical protein
MSELATPTGALGLTSWVSGRPNEPFSGTTPLANLLLSRQDYRILASTSGAITDRVVVKNGNVEVPFVLGRVWLLRLVDGFKAWEGWSDADGYYTATGLELGAEYVAVAIDPTRNHKTAGAGPVIAS